MDKELVRSYHKNLVRQYKKIRLAILSLEDSTGELRRLNDVMERELSRDQRRRGSRGGSKKSQKKTRKSQKKSQKKQGVL